MKRVMVCTVFKRTESNQCFHVDKLKKPEIVALLDEQIKYPGNVYFGYNELLHDEWGQDKITLAEWLDSKGVSLAIGDKQRLAREVAKRYKAEYGGTPNLAYRPDSKGRHIVKAYGFLEHERWVLEDTLKELQTTVTTTTISNKKTRKSTKAK